MVQSSEFIEEFPYEMQLAIKGLNHQTRQKILNLLNNKGKMSFSEILEHIKIDGSLLANHLNKLIESLLVERFYEHEITKDKYSYYQLSKFGQRILLGLNNMFFIKKETTTTVQIMIKQESKATGFFGDQIITKNQKKVITSNSGVDISSFNSFIKKEIDIDE